MRWVAVAGGDGTVEAAARAFDRSDVPTRNHSRGTYNNLALSAGIPIDPIEACRIIAAGKVRPVDVGFVNGRPFFEVVGLASTQPYFRPARISKPGIRAPLGLARKRGASRVITSPSSWIAPFTAARKSARHADGTHHGRSPFRCARAHAPVSRTPPITA